MEKQIILLAGGTGMIGKQMQVFLQKQGHEVRILSRKPSDSSKNIFHWQPTKDEIDVAALNGVTTIINLSGAGIADKRWTAERKREMTDSRVQPTQFLVSLAPKMPELKQYISASGINCYGYDNHAKVYQENDPFGKDFLSRRKKVLLVEKK
jgi:NAD dependent epimerase/dehydratase family enzyme